jgi:hypothetical protein
MHKMYSYVLYSILFVYSLWFKYLVEFMFVLSQLIRFVGGPEGEIRAVQMLLYSIQYMYNSRLTATDMGGDKYKKDKKDKKDKKGDKDKEDEKSHKEKKEQKKEKKDKEKSEKQKLEEEKKSGSSTDER